MGENKWRISAYAGHYLHPASTLSVIVPRIYNKIWWGSSPIANPIHISVPSLIRFALMDMRTGDHLHRRMT
jgi:hypothetical protein